MSVDKFMQQLAAQDAASPVPQAPAIWWRAELRRRLEAEERATRPIRVAGALAYAACAAAAALAAAQFGPAAWMAVAGTAALTAGGAVLALRSR
jgi:hypothetical protein